MKKLIDQTYDEELSNAELLEEYRSYSFKASEPIDKQIIMDILQILLPIKNMTKELLSNSTTNKAEYWMSICSKMDGLKRVNHGDTSSWQTRCIAARFRINLGVQWSPNVWEAITGTPCT